MKIRFDNSGKISEFERLARELSHDPAVKGLMVLGCDANGWDEIALTPMIKSLQKPILGGVFPQIIFERQIFSNGCLVIGLTVAPEITLVNGLSDPAQNFERQLQPFAEAIFNCNNGCEDTFLVFVDGLSKRIASLVEAMFFSFGLEVNYIGGGAGSLSFVQKPCIISPEGFSADSAVIIRLPMASGIGVSHGWNPVSPSMKVTEADRNRIITLDWKPALNVYRSLVEQHSGLKFTDSNFFDIAKSYPFGISKLGGEMVVRDPLLVGENASIVCVGEVPAGCFVRLLNGDPEALIAAAAKASGLAEDSTPANHVKLADAFIVDCVSRSLFLEKRIDEELAAAAGNKRLFGAMTIGEIANTGKEYLEFYNKTLVVGIFAHKPEVSY